MIGGVGLMWSRGGGSTRDNGVIFYSGGEDGREWGGEAYVFLI